MQKTLISSTFDNTPPPTFTDWPHDPKWAGAVISALSVALVMSTALAAAKVLLIDW